MRRLNPAFYANLSGGCFYGGPALRAEQLPIKQISTAIPAYTNREALFSRFLYGTAKSCATLIFRPALGMMRNITSRADLHVVSFFDFCLTIRTDLSDKIFHENTPNKNSDLLYLTCNKRSSQYEKVDLKITISCSANNVFACFSARNTILSRIFHNLVYIFSDIILLLNHYNTAINNFQY